MDDCFDKILEAHGKSDEMKYKVIIKLMKDLENGISNALRVRNCLILLLNLSSNEKYGDYLDRIGKRPHELNQHEKYDMYEILKTEFNN